MKRFAVTTAFLCLATIVNVAVAAPVSVLTYHNDNARLGRNTSETVLTVGNVNSSTFGKLFSYSVDGYVYAQPLILPNVTIPGKGVHTVLFVATEHNSVYAFDADSNAGANASPLWQVNFNNPGAGVTTVPYADLDGTCVDVVPEIGITGTPVIDSASGTLYVVVKTREISGNTTNFPQRLHALNVTTGAEKFGGPVVIQGSVPGNGEGSDGLGNMPFNSKLQLHRSALLLHNGVVYMAFGSHCDIRPYHGWVFGYNATTLATNGIFCVSPNGDSGGIWEAGNGPAVDASGNLYVATGNGNFDQNTSDYGDSIIRLSTSGNKLTATDFFTPYNQQTMNDQDQDLSSGGLIILPDEAGSGANPHLLVMAGKLGTMYLVNRDNMGHYDGSGDTQIPQELNVLQKNFCTPAYFNRTLYFMANKDPLKAFVISNSVIATSPSSQSSVSFGFPGATPCVSANGTSDGIVWVIQTEGAKTNAPAILHAFNAANVSQELYNSTQAGSRDYPGAAVKFNIPTIANGKVYVGTQNSLAVYGNLSGGVAVQSVTPGNQNYGLVEVGQMGTLSFQVANNGAATLSGSAAVTGPFAIASGTPYTISPGQSSNVEVTYSPVAVGAFTNYVVFTSNGGISSNTVNGTAANYPVAQFSGSPTSGTVPLNVTFTDTSTGTISSRSWTFGDGGSTITTATSVQHNYSVAGTNTVRLLITGPFGTSTNTKSAYIIAGAVAAPSQTITPGSQNFGLLAVGKVSTQIFRVVNNGSGSLSGTATANGPYAILNGSPYTVSAGQTGTVNVTFNPVAVGGFTNSVIFASNGGTSTNTVTGTAAIVPTALFTASPTNGLTPLAVTFTDTSTGTITNRTWTFGDGGSTITTATSVPHTYNSAGSQTVRLIAYGPLGISTNTKASFIEVNSTGPLLSVDPGSLAFGLMNVGQVTTQNFYIINAGNSLLSGSVSYAPPFTVINGDTYDLNSGEGATIRVEFNPVAAGSFSNSVTFTSNGGNFTGPVTGSAAVPVNAEFNGSPTSGSAPLAVTFTDTSTGTITSRAWTFGDGGGTITTATSVSHTYNAANAYTVTLAVSGPFGITTNSKASYIVATADPALQSVGPASQDFGWVAVGQTSTQSFQVSNAGINTLNGSAAVSSPFSVLSGSPYVLGSSQSGTVKILFSPSAAGAFTGSVSFTSNGGNTTKPVTGKGAVVPTAFFSATPTNGLAPLAVTFTDTSTGTITNRAWSFGDGSTTNTTTTSLAHVYASTGTNTVRLIAYGPVGISTNTKLAYIVATNLPAHQVVSPGSIDFGLREVGKIITQNFQVINTGLDPLTGTASSSEPFSIASGAAYQLNGGKTGTVSVAFHPTDMGSFTGKVFFASNGGISTNVVTGRGTFAPVADFTASPTNGQVALTVVFLNSSGGVISGQLWSFGDGSTSTATTPTHIYSSPGTYSVSLTVMGTLGTNTLTRSNLITVTNLAPPVADFIASPVSGAAALTTFFTDNSQGSVTSRLWSFGDGAASTAAATTHTYTTPGTYSVSLTVVGAGGTNTITRNSLVTVAPPTAPQVTILSPADGMQYPASTNLVVKFIAHATSGNTITKLEFFDGDDKLSEATTALATNLWSNPAPGLHVLTVRATDSLGTTNTSASAHIMVGAKDSPLGTWEITVKGADQGLGYFTFEEDFTWNGYEIRKDVFGLSELTGTWAKGDKPGADLGTYLDTLNGVTNASGTFTAKVTSLKKFAATALSTNSTPFRWHGLPLKAIPDLNGTWLGLVRINGINNDLNLVLTQTADPGVYDVGVVAESTIGQVLITSRNKVSAYLYINGRKTALMGSFNPGRSMIKMSGRNEDDITISVQVSQD